MFESKLGIEIQAFLSSKLTELPLHSSQVACAKMATVIIARKPLRKLALVPSELELLRSHPKDERGSVREIGLWLRMDGNLHFSSYPPSLRSG